MGRLGIAVADATTLKNTLGITAVGEQLLKAISTQSVVDTIGVTAEPTSQTFTASIIQDQANATLLTARLNIVTIGNSLDCVKLPPAISAKTIFVQNLTGNTIQIWPSLGDDLGSGINQPMFPENSALFYFMAIDATTWIQPFHQKDLINMGVVAENPNGEASFKGIGNIPSGTFRVGGLQFNNKENNLGGLEWYTDNNPARAYVILALYRDGALVVPFEVQSDGHIKPRDDNTYDMGQPTRRYRTMYLGPQSLYLGNIPVTEASVMRPMWTAMSERIILHRETVKRQSRTLEESPIFAEALDESTTILSENFDGATHSFTLTGLWAVGSPGAGDPPAQSGTKYLKTRLGSNYLNNENGLATSPTFSTVGQTKVTLSFKTYIVTESRWDFLYVEVLDGSAVIPLGIPNRVDGVPSNATTLQSGRQPNGIDGNATSGAFKTFAYDLPSTLMGKTSLQIRFRFTSDISIVYRGVAIDDFTISGKGDFLTTTGSPFISTAVLKPVAPTHFICLVEDDSGTGTIFYDISRNNGVAYQTISTSSFFNVKTISGGHQIRATAPITFTAISGTQVVIKATLTGNAKLYGVSVDSFGG